MREKSSLSMVPVSYDLSREHGISFIDEEMG